MASSEASAEATIKEVAASLGVDWATIYRTLGLGGESDAGTAGKP
jgi:hypothetical protein